MRKQEINIERAHELLNEIDRLTPQTKGLRGLFCGHKARRELMRALNELEGIIVGIEI